MARNTVVLLLVSGLINGFLLRGIRQTASEREVRLGEFSVERPNYELRFDGRCIARFTLTRHSESSSAVELGSTDGTASGFFAMNPLGQLIGGTAELVLPDSRLGLVQQHVRSYLLYRVEQGRSRPRIELPIVVHLQAVSSGRYALTVDWVPSAAGDPEETTQLLDILKRTRIEHAGTDHCG
jgi:hypothetical protein